MDQRGDVVHQSVQFKRRTNALAHFGNHCQLVSLAAQVTIKTSTFHGTRDRIRQSTQDEQIIGMEGLELVALNIQHTQYTLSYFEWEGNLRTRFRQNINKTITRILPDIINNNACSLPRSLPN